MVVASHGAPQLPRRPAVARAEHARPQREPRLVRRARLELAQTAAQTAAAPEPDGQGGVQVRPQPVFCLLHVDLLESLVAFTHAGGRKIDAWTGQHGCAIVPFDQPGDDPQAFFNANTLAELHALEGAAGR